MKVQISLKNRNCSKIHISLKSQYFHFWAKFRFFRQISIFAPNFNCSAKFRGQDFLIIKIQISLKNRNCSKIHISLKSQNFCQKIESGTSDKLHYVYSLILHIPLVINLYQIWGWLTRKWFSGGLIVSFNSIVNIGLNNVFIDS